MAQRNAKLRFFQRDNNEQTDFIECVLCPLTTICSPQGRVIYKRKIMLHFDNAPVHNTEEVQESLGNFGFRRIEHPSYRPDFASCNFLLFSAMKKRLLGNILIPLTIFLWVWRHFWDGFLRTSSGPFVRNGHSHCS
jgi:hypothetical protein